MRANHRYAGQYGIVRKGLEYGLLDVKAILNKDDNGVLVGYCGCNYLVEKRRDVCNIFGRAYNICRST